MSAGGIASSGGARVVAERREGSIVVVCPCRNEERYARRTLDALLAQTHPLAAIVVVDDGSTDGTPAILAEYAARHATVHVVRREDRGHRSVGPGVVDAFYAGLDAVDLDSFEFVCKLDLDLDLPPAYFAELVARMRANPRLGSCSGKPWYRDAAGRVQREWCDDEIVVGMTKFYRVDCFRQIGGFVREVMWDGIDSHRCRQLGWIAHSVDAPEVRFEHLRPMGSSDKNVLRGRRRHGHGQYFMGTSFAFMLASTLRRLAQPPYVLGALAMLWGYLGSWAARRPRYDAPGFRPFLRSYQWQALMRGKRRAIARIDSDRAAAWRPSRPATHEP